MSWNLATRLNNIQQEVNTIINMGLTNPLESSLDASGFEIFNISNLTGTSGAPLNLNAGVNQPINLNAPVNIPNHTLEITNNTASDCLQVLDSIGDTTIFRIDQNGSVGINVAPSLFSLSDALVVNGNIKCLAIDASNIIQNLNAGNSITLAGTINNRIIGLNNNINVNSISATGSTLNLNSNLSALDISCGTLYYTNLQPAIDNSFNFISFVGGYNGALNYLPNRFIGAIYTLNNSTYTNCGSYIVSGSVSVAQQWVKVRILNPISSILAPVTFTITYWNGSAWIQHPSAVGWTQTVPGVVPFIEMQGLVLPFSTGLYIGIGVIGSQAIQSVTLNNSDIYYSAYEINNIV
jgi:hypothetical protein